MTKKEKQVVMIEAGKVMSIARQLEMYAEDYDLSKDSEIRELAKDAEEISEKLRKL